MDKIFDRKYYMQQLLRNRDLAKAARDPRIADIHWTLARRYGYALFGSVVKVVSGDDAIGNSHEWPSR